MSAAAVTDQDITLLREAFYKKLEDEKLSDSRKFPLFQFLFYWCRV